jgi:hydrogenase maturation factor
MKIKSVDGFAAVCEAKGIEREVACSCCRARDRVGDHVLVHVGTPSVVSEEDARSPGTSTRRACMNCRSASTDRAGRYAARENNAQRVVSIVIAVGRCPASSPVA